MAKMDGSRALSRCLQQLSIHNQNCLRTQLTAATATSRLRTPRHSSKYNTRSSRQTSRAFVTSHRALQDEPSQSTPQPPNQQTQAQPPTPQPRSHRSLDLSSLLSDNADNQTASGRQQQPSSSSSSTARKPSDTAFAQKIHSQLDAIVAEQRQRSAAPHPRRQSNYDTYGAGGTLFNQTRSPTRPAGPTPSPSDLALSMKNWVDSPIDPIDQKLLEETRELARAREQLRLHPSLGKTVDVNEAAGFGVTRAFITLEAKINGRGNAVRKDEKEQKFHVRRGQKKKLKRSERWRVVFRQGFLGECARVRKMIRQGW